LAETFINELLEQLRSHRRDEAWALFIQEYAAPIFHVIRRFEPNADDASDCFQFVCEQLVRNSFRRLRAFQPDGPAMFSTWLRAVVRNLCLDWHRKRFGRRRIFRSITRLSDLDQEIFRCVHEGGASPHEAVVVLAPRFPKLTLDIVSEAIERINKALNTNQRWLLRARSLAARLNRPESEETRRTFEPSDSQPDPEARVILEEKRAIAIQALGRLTKREKLLMRLRFEEELTLEQIATLLDLGNAQRVDRQINEILSKLRRDVGSIANIDTGGKTAAASVKALRNVR
jgi:RNA polymerase sigma factor (sigma-70 family)